MEVEVMRVHLYSCVCFWIILAMALPLSSKAQALDVESSLDNIFVKGFNFGEGGAGVIATFLC